jgi:hypothetical protein
MFDIRHEVVESHMQSSVLFVQTVLEGQCADCDEYHNYPLSYTGSFVIGIANKEEEAYKAQLQKI